MKIVVIDGSIAGVSGDMFLSALIDLGGDKNKILELANYLNEKYEEIQIKINVHKTDRKGIQATLIEIKIEDQISTRTAEEILKKLVNTLNNVNISEKGKKLAIEILNKIIQAESVVHGKDIKEIHLHETGSFDTILDIVGTLLLCEDLNLLDNTRWVSLLLSVGGGEITFSHGKISVPAPATTEILNQSKFKIRGGPVKTELATPTGVAILTTLAGKQIDFMPTMKVEKIGYGAGVKNFQEISNVLRIIIGESGNFMEGWEIISEITTKVDDISGEIIGNLITNMINSGKIKDIDVIPTITKKNRPGYLITLLSNLDNELDNIKYLISETGTLGVRVSHVSRRVLEREIVKKKVELKNIEFEIAIKVSRDESGIINFKVEMDDANHIAESLGLPLRIVLKRIYEKLNKNDFI
jgi:hypothetical protein